MAALHERWFVPDDLYPVRYEVALTPEFWVPAGIAAGAAALVIAAWHLLGRPRVLPGPLALDWQLQREHRPIPELLRHAVPALRRLTGASIAVLACTEKLLNVPMGVAFLARYPFNVFPALGLEGVSDADFVRIAGAVELAFGLLLMAGAFLRPLILVVWLPFNLTLPFLGWRELVGHLPIYGIMALLLVWGEARREVGEALERGMEAQEGS